MAILKTFEVTTLPQSSVLYLYSIREKILLDPHYQREGDVWSIYKRQLLLDSLINGFDVPKIYFHDLGPSSQKRYAVVDGKQRLQSIWQFLDDEFPLSDDFVFFSEPDIKLSGLYYSDLSKRFPHIKIKLDATSLTVVRVETDDLEFIEEMFSRLNEAVPLSSAEKRRTFGGTASTLIANLTNHEFFQTSVYFKDHRSRYFDVASKIIYLEYLGSIADTKREYLDAFVRDAKKDVEIFEGMKQAENRTNLVLNELSAIFNPQDKLLKQVGIIPVYYWFVRACLLVPNGAVRVDRDDFEKFEEARELVKKASPNDELLSFDLAGVAQFNRLAQTPNDAYAIEFRVSVLVEMLIPEEFKSSVLANASRYAMFAHPA